MTISRLLDAGQPIAQMERYPLRFQVLREWDRYLRIEWGHDLRQLLQYGHRESAMDQILYHLQSDKSAADDDRGVGPVIGNPLADTAGGRNDWHRRDTAAPPPRARRPAR